MQVQQYRQYLDMMNQWLILKQEGKGIERYFEKNNYYLVAVYGMAIYGRHVIRELKKTEISVAYGIDRKKMNPYEMVEIIQPTGTLPLADAVVNTVIYEHEAIKSLLAELTDIPVISLEEVVYGSYA